LHEQPGDEAGHRHRLGAVGRPLAAGRRDEVVQRQPHPLELGGDGRRRLGRQAVQGERGGGQRAAQLV
jgi:hypothetical protein